MFNKLLRGMGLGHLSSRYILILVVVLLLFIASVIFGALSVWRLAVVGLIIIQFIILVLVAQSRTVLSRRLFAVARQVEHRFESLGRRVAFSPNSKNENASSNLTGSNVSQKTMMAKSGAGEATQKSLIASTSLVLKSQIFDREWYEAQSGIEFDTDREACFDYLTTGRKNGLSPHPLFLPSMLDPNWKTSKRDPLVEYLNSPSVNRIAMTHPLFDPRIFDEKSSGRIDRDWGALYTFLQLKTKEQVLPAETGTDWDVESIRYQDFRRKMLVASKEWTSRQMHFVPLKGSEERPVASEKLHDLLDEYDNQTGPRPLVSVVLPTWNRAAQLRKAIESVQRQSYVDWELLVADDGSTDDTQISVREESRRDPRIIYLPLAHRGVSAARNAALEKASGEFVAFLDSDKEWDPEFLRVMVAWMKNTHVQAAAATCEVRFGSRTVFFSEPATAASLSLGNSIDQTALVVSLDLVKSFGGFDEGLKRAVDYDLIMSIAARTAIDQVPFIGVRYSEDQTDPNRISEAESVSWNFYVSDRRRWINSKDAAPHELTTGLVSVVVDGVASFKQAREVIGNLHEFSGDRPMEITLVAADNTWLNWCLLLAATYTKSPVKLVHAHHGGIRPIVINDAMRQASGEFLFIMHGNQRFYAGTMDELIITLGERNVGAVHPAVLDKTRLVHDLGVVYGASVSEPIPLGEGLPLDGLEMSSPISVPGAGLPLLVRTEHAVKVSGFNTKIKSLWSDIDFSQRISRSNGHSVLVDSNVVIQENHRSPFDRQTGALADIRMFRDLWPTPPGGSEAARAALGLPVTGVSGFSAMSFPSDPGKWGRLEMRKPKIDVFEHEPRLRWAVKCAAPADARSDVWGDFHFANSLAKSLRSLGQTVSVDYQENSARRTSDLDDVVINLRGLRDVALPVNSLNILWIISHPEAVSSTEVAKYDRVYAASSKWAAQQNDQWQADIRVLLQCTDSNLFYPDYDAEIAREHPLLFVGNSREVYRPAPWTAARAGLPVKIYGGGWKGLVPDDNIAGSFIANDILRKYYSSAGYTLNDHWSEMREDGFISNRIFDVVASGGNVITDEVAGLSDVFGNEVRTFKNPYDLLQMLSVPKSPLGLRQGDSGGEASKRVRQLHSFDARARELYDDVIEIARRKDYKAE